jgi:hypothetical protein
MILIIFFAESGEKMEMLTQQNLCRKINHINIGFQGSRQYFGRKLLKIAKNCSKIAQKLLKIAKNSDRNIDPTRLC